MANLNMLHRLRYLINDKENGEVVKHYISLWYLQTSANEVSHVQQYQMELWIEKVLGR
jgi:macrodomain Ter protein organizer (MatP/YcbG family)